LEALEDRRLLSTLRFDSNTPVAITSSETDAPLNVAGVGPFVGKVQVSLYLTFPYISALNLALVAPDGTAVTLVSQFHIFGSGFGTAATPDSARTTFDDSAATPIGAGGFGFFTGAFQPEQPLATFIGKSGSAANGTWTLRIQNAYTFYSGTLNAWSLTLTTASAVADLGVSLAAAPNPALTGGNVVYTVTLTNRGPSPATNVTLNETLPDNAAFQTLDAPPGFSCTTPAVGGSAATVTCTAPVLNVDQQVTFTVTVQLDPDTPNGAPVASTATVTSDAADPLPSNNTATAQVPANRPGRLQFSAAEYSIKENRRTATIFVTRTDGTGGTVSAEVSTHDDTAVAGSDYTAVATRVTFADGDAANKAVFIPIVDNGTVDGNRTVVLTLDNLTGGAELGNPPTANLTIRDIAGTPSERFVAQVYLDLLHRKPDPSGLAAWTGLLDRGFSRLAVTLLIEDSAEYRARVVTDLYTSLLRRPPDPNGLANFTGLLAAGATVPQVQAMLAGSAEYLALWGIGGSTGFVDALYHDALGRDVDLNGLQTFGQMFAATSGPQAVAAAIFESREAAGHRVSEYYQRFLHRAADFTSSGFADALASGSRDEQIIAFLVGSDEYFQRLSAST
jgi:uncharacterized repeat protein (TIGR01451 family)